MYHVIILCDSDIFGTWTLDHIPSVPERLQIKKLVADTVKAEGLQGKYSVQFSIPDSSGTVTEVLQGIKDSLANS